MLLALVEKLIDGCLRFCAQRQEKRRLSFADSVEPVYQSCQNVHEQYLESFRTYRDSLSEPGAFSANLQALCDRLGTASRFPADQEAKVILFMEVSRQQLTSYLRDDSQVAFITEIRSYVSRALTEVCGAHYAGGTLRVASPVFRNSLAGRLKKIMTEASLTEHQKQAAAAQVLDGIVAELETSFAAVTKRYLALRGEMPG